MANNQLEYIEPERVRAMAARFDVMATVLRGINGILEIQMMLLKTTCFIGLVGGGIAEQYINRTKPHIEELITQFTEIAGDLRVTAEQHDTASDQG